MRSRCTFDAIRAMTGRLDGDRHIGRMTALLLTSLVFLARECAREEEQEEEETAGHVGYVVFITLSHREKDALDAHD